MYSVIEKVLFILLMLLAIVSIVIAFIPNMFLYIV